jgi:coenzyme F420-reducing hydrogenase alpha subunit
VRRPPGVEPIIWHRVCAIVRTRHGFASVRCA